MQGIEGGWRARLGFVLFDSAVIAVSFVARRTWGVLATGLHLVFGISMLGVAAFSTRPWMTGVAFDRTEDQSTRCSQPQWVLRSSGECSPS